MCHTDHRPLYLICASGLKNNKKVSFWWVTTEWCLQHFYYTNYPFNVLLWVVLNASACFNVCRLCCSCKLSTKIYYTKKMSYGFLTRILRCPASQPLRNNGLKMKSPVSISRFLISRLLLGSLSRIAHRLQAASFTIKSVLTQDKYLREVTRSHRVFYLWGYCEAVHASRKALQSVI